MATAPLTKWIAVAQRHGDASVSDVIDPVHCSGVDAEDRCIYAVADVEKGSTLVTLSSAASYLNGTTWLQQQTDDALQAKVNENKLSGTIKTILALLAECALGEKSKFHGYICQLPTTLHLPLLWTPEQRLLLKHTAAFDATDADLVVNLFFDAASPLMTQYSSVWQEPWSTLDKFLWAYAIGSSRAFTDKASGEPTLLPVIDMANHDQENPAARIESTSTGGFQLIALRDIKKGEAVTISYGDLSNTQLLCRYGFVQSPPTPLDSILVSAKQLVKIYEKLLIGDTEEDPHPSKRQKTNNNDQFFALHADAEAEYGISDTLLAFVFVQNFPVENLYDVLAILLQQKDKSYSHVLEENEEDTATAQASLAMQLLRHERDVCRRVLLGIMSLEEASDDEESDEE